MARCLWGTWQIKTGVIPQTPSNTPEVDCITFSVLAKMSALWAETIERAIPTRPLRVLIGDCSGELSSYLRPNPLVINLPLFNYNHGEKLDIFLYKVCRAEYVVVTDDDIFWLDEIPWRWALKQLESDPQVAVVSIVPKPHTPKSLEGKVPMAMGSCFIVRRSIWLKEKLSFRVVPLPPSEGWLYDTGEYAQLQLIKRGYRIVYAPEEIRAHMERLEGISVWALKIQRRAGDIQKETMNSDSLGAEKVLRVIFALRGLTRLIAEFNPTCLNPNIVQPGFLARAENICAQKVTPQSHQENRMIIEKELNSIRECLLASLLNSRHHSG